MSSANGCLTIIGRSFTTPCASWFARPRAGAASPPPPSWTAKDVKSANHGGSVGYDAGKRIKGRKRHLLVDTLGLVLGVAVTPADTTERDGAQLLLGRVLVWFAWLRRLWVDGG